MRRSKTIVMLLMLAMVLLYVTERVGIVHVGYELEQLKARKVKLVRERDELKVKLSSITAPERIARVATDTLGLVPPKQGQIVMVRVDTGKGQEARTTQARLQLAKYEPRGPLP